MELEPVVCDSCRTRIKVHTEQDIVSVGAGDEAVTVLIKASVYIELLDHSVPTTLLPYLMISHATQEEHLVLVGWVGHTDDVGCHLAYLLSIHGYSG